MLRSEMYLKHLLRLNGLIGMLAAFAVVMPNAWLDWCVSQIQAEVSGSFLVEFLARSLSMLFLLVGVLLVVFASDVIRFRVPITFVAVWILMSVGGLCLYIGPYLTQLAQQWFFWLMVADAGWATLFALSILVLQRNIRCNKLENLGA